MEAFTPAGRRQWAEKLLAQCLENRWQRWWDLPNAWSWGGAAAYLRGYLFDGRHTCYAVERMVGDSRTYTDVLADEVLGVWG
jgi:hypothetical protein